MSRDKAPAAVRVIWASINLIGALVPVGFLAVVLCGLAGIVFGLGSQIFQFFFELVRFL